MSPWSGQTRRRCVIVFGQRFRKRAISLIALPADGQRQSRLQVPHLALCDLRQRAGRTDPIFATGLLHEPGEFP